MSDLLADLIGSFTDIDQDLYTLTPNNMWSILVQTHSDKSMLPHTLQIVAHIYTCMHDRTHADTHKRTTGTQTHPVFLLKQKRYSYFLLTQTCIVFLLNRYCSHITLSFISLPLCVSHTCTHTHKNTRCVVPLLCLVLFTTWLSLSSLVLSAVGCRGISCPHQEQKVAQDECCFLPRLEHPKHCTTTQPLFAVPSLSLTPWCIHTSTQTTLHWR
jgi:hypothetical protein